jgi:preprotein translocase subunit YajC
LSELLFWSISYGGNSMLFYSVAYAQQAGKSGPALTEQLFLPFFIIVIFYFFIIRPQSKRQKKHQDFLSKMKRGDSVLTSSGMFGTIEGLNDRFVILNVSEGVNVRVLKSQISSSVNEEK